MSFPVVCPPRFTPRARTPWGGRRIARRKGLADEVVGESWECSFEPDFPTLLPDGQSLADLVRTDPTRWLGAPDAADLLVKWLDADDDLSAQIHPDDEHPGLAPDECGKPESWYVVEAAPDAAIHLGLAEGVTRATLEAALREGRTDGLLHRVPVAPGDFFVLEPGLPHAIGRGVFVVEPQRVRAGRRGVTYRFHDWGRRYDAAGRRDPHGTPRPLHVTEALAVTRFELPRGDALVARVRLRAGAPDVHGSLQLTPLAGPGGVDSAHLRVARLAGTGTLHVVESSRLSVCTVLDGTLVARDTTRTLQVATGSTVALPASFRGSLHGTALHAVWSRIAEPGAPPDVPG